MAPKRRRVHCKACNELFFHDTYKHCASTTCKECPEFQCQECFRDLHATCNVCGLFAERSLRRCAVCGVANQKHCYWKVCEVCDRELRPSHKRTCDTCDTVICENCRQIHTTYCEDCALKLRDLLENTKPHILPVVLTDMVLDYLHGVEFWGSDTFIARRLKIHYAHTH